MTDTTRTLTGREADAACASHVQPIYFRDKKRWVKTEHVDNEGRYCGYLWWHSRAASSIAKHESQIKCPGCNRWFFPWERFS